MSDLVLVGPAPLARELAVSTARAREFAAAGVAENTKRAYSGQWSRFATWCQGRGVDALPAEPTTVAAYLADLADRGLAPASIDLALTAISQAHKVADLPSPRVHPIVAKVRRGLRRTLTVAQKGKAPLLAGALRPAMLDGGVGLAALRDHALLLLGWNGAFRRSEIVGLDLGDVRFVARGLELTLQRSKTDQEGKGRVVTVPRAKTAPELCPEKVLRTWIAAAPITDGALFRRVDRWGHVGGRLSGHAVAGLVKRVAEAAGLDAREFAGHSLRSGLVTEAALHGRSEAAIMKLTGHTSVAMVRRYIRTVDAWRDVASDGLLEQP